MKYIEDFLLELGQLDIKVWAESDRLRCKAPKGVLTTELRAELAERKADILQFLHKKALFEQAIPPLSKAEALPISLAQQRLWFLAQLEGKNASYNMPAALHIEGQLNEIALQRALMALIQRHDSLRLCFPMVDGEATVQRGEVYNPLSITDLSVLSKTSRQHQVTGWIANHAQTPFDFSTGPLLSLRLLKLGPQEQILLFNMHHIISDGWSMAVLVRDWSQLYSAYAQREVPQLPILKIQYTDYAAWQKNWLQGEILEQQRAYWTEKLAGLPELLELPTDYPRPAVMRYQGQHWQSTLAPELTQKIKRLSQQHGVTNFMTLLAAFKVLLFRYSGQTDLVVGSPIANRTHYQTEDLIGFFVNTLVLRTKIKGVPTFSELLAEVRQTALEAYSHQDIPFEYLVEQLNPSRSLSHSPLFQVMFVLQNAPQEALEFSDLKMSFLEPENTTAKFDLTLNIAEHGEVFVCDWEYCTDLFRSDTITRMTEHFQVLLEGILNNPEQSLSFVPLLIEAEQKQLLAWNQTETDYPIEKTIVDLFQAQVEKTPENIAVVFENQQLSYWELNQKANQLAHYLMTLGVGGETLVGIFVERSLEMVIGLLGILKAGGAYVPFDPDYPLQRLQFMLEDSSVKVLLSQSHLLEKLPAPTAKVVSLDSEWATIAAYSGENLGPQSGPDNLAYVIYTSGSTGVPKGVCVPIKAVVRLVHQTNYACLDAGQTFLQYAPVSFDAATLELWGAFLNGAKLVVMPPHKRSLSQLSQVLQEQGVTILWLTSSLFNLMLDEQFEGLLGLKQLLVGGEELSVSHIQRALNILSGTQVINGYGPTENTTFTCCYPISRKDYPVSIPIGKPIANTSVYILDEYQQPLPIGLAGELYTGGLGLARGYLNHSELTADKFIEVEVFGKPQRLYKTGDLARWLPDGNLEYLGRLDHQVKLRGFRIELGEIETTLSQHDSVTDAVVLLYNKEDNPRLVAYVTLVMPLDDVLGVLRTWLKTRLPEYMLPASFMVLDKLPLTPNGKIDRQALPAPDLVIQAVGPAPRTETEQLLCNIWSQVLGISVTSRHIHFFEAGGHSLLATQLVSRIRESFGIEMPLRVIFEHPILQEQAEWLDSEQRGSKLPPIMSRASGEPLVLSFAQQRLWFLAQLEGQSTTYNMPAALHIEGQLNETALQRALTALTQRHDSLRFFFPVVDGEATLQLGDVYNPLSVTDLSELSGTEQQHLVSQWVANHAQTPFDLSTGPLLSLRLLKMGQQEQILLFNMHHIISDGWSMAVLVRDWSQLYSAYAQNQVPKLPPLPIQYTDYAAWQRNWLQGEVLEQQLAYWTKKLTGVPELLDLPTDYPRPAVMRYQGQRLPSTLDIELTRGIKQLSQQHGVTDFMTLLAAFKVLLFRYSGQTDLVVGSPIANRTHHQTEDLVGFFVNTLVLRSQINGKQTFSELLKPVRQTALEAYSHQDIPFEYLVEQVQPSRSLSYSPLFQVMFVLQNAPQEALELSDLKMSFLEPENTTAKFDLTLSIAEIGEVFVCDWEYCTDLFRSDTIARMAEHFQVLLEGILNNPEQSLCFVPLLTEAEQQQLLAWNQIQTDYPIENTIVDLFQAQVDKTPDNIAVVFEEQTLSYFQLNTKANQLAHYLMTLGVGAETLVGICVERSLDMVIGLLGILKAGGAYVPLDPDYPPQRLQFLLEDSKVPVLLSQSHLLERLPTSAAKVVGLDSDWEQIAAGSGENPIRQSGPDNLAYVIYTSGSTGKPKGCQVTQSNVTRLFATTQEWYHFNHQDVWTLFHSYAFDFSVWEIWGALLYGAQLVVVPYFTSRTPEDFYQLLIEQRVTVLNQTPSAFKQLINVDSQPDELSLRLVIFGGEALDFATLQPWFARHGEKQPQLVNMYGITETTVHVTYYPLISEPSQSIIGRPLPDLQVWVVDAHHQPVPIGVPGEMYVGGAGVARGYLNRPELTAEKFIEVELLGQRQRLYKTGDLARWLEDGNLEYLGRLDNQVKVRGFRIELFEIEAVLQQHPAIQAGIVTTWANEKLEKRLVAYLLPTVQSEPPEIHELQTFLKQYLPDYMLPAAFVVIEQIPLNANGKIDYRVLPSPIENRLEDTQTFVAPSTHEEHLLAEIWQEVLKAKPISTHNNFFELGGDSILSIRIVAKVKQAGYTLLVQDIFLHPTIAQLAQRLKGQETQTDSQPLKMPFSLISETEKALLPADVEDAYPLAALQAGMLFHSHYEMDSAVYHNVSSYYLQAPYDESMLPAAVQHLSELHPVLRTSFHFKEFNEPLQYVHRQVQVPFTVRDIRHLSSEEQEMVIDEWMATEKRQAFDWECAPLLRVSIHQRGNDTFNLTVTEHHAILDGWSVASLMTELLREYLYRIDQDQMPAMRQTPPNLHYRDFIALEIEAIASEATQTFWQQQLEETTFARIPRLPKAHRTVSTNYQYEVVIPSTLSKAIKQLADNLEVPVKTVLLAAHLRVISLFSGSTDIVTGLVTNGRPEREGGEKIAGLFLNTLPFRLQLQPNDNWTQLIQATFQKEQAILPHRRYPLIEMQKTHQGLPLFETAFNFTHFHVYQGILETDVVKLLGFKGFEQTNFVQTCDFSLDLITGDVRMSLSYNPDELELNQIKSMGLYYLQVLAMMTEQSAASSNVCLLPTEVKQLQHWNATETDYPIDKTIVDLFQALVEKTPDNIAVVFEGQVLSYQALNTKANQLAHYLMALGVGAETLVGICVERSLEMVIGLLGILKAGGAYVPFDPDYPMERLQFMLEDSNVPVLLSQTHLLERLPSSIAKVVYLDSEWEQIAAGSGENPVRQSGPENLAYVIYTSGSTGKPKGVMVEHTAIAQHVYFSKIRYQVESSDKILQFASLNFDASIEQIFTTWCGGAQLVLLSTNLLPAQNLQMLLETEQITIADLPSAYWQQLLNSASTQHLKQLKLLILGNEPLSSQLAYQTRQYLNKEVLFLNAYGPTEATITATLFEVTEQFQDNHTEKVTSIGQPIVNTQIYILDTHHNPTPLGIPGELCIGGHGLARGYLNRPELTQEKFIELKLFGEKQRIYQTGDVARWLPDGNIEYLGRIDHQVKLRGFRIELGEIEAVLSQHEAVNETVVVLYNPENNPRLVAYVTLTMPLDEVAGVLRAWLRYRLPEYMLPASFTVLDKLPLTPNGKIDRKALPTPDAREADKHYQAPRDLVELQLARIWEEVLEVRPIGIFENFFELGGHSLIAVKLMSHIQQTFDRHIPIASLFQGATIAELASVIHDQDSTWPTLIPIQPQGSRDPLFCLPGAGGNVLYLHSLATHLGKDQPCYGLQPPGLDGNSITPSSIEALAAIYLKELHKVQPQGPYFLAGHSFGGFVAFELASQLEQQGEAVALLAILDTEAPTSQIEDDNTALMNETDWLWEIVEILEELTETKLGLDKEMLQSQTTLEQSYDLIMQPLKQQGIFFAPTAESDQLKAAVDTYKANTHAHIHYHPQGRINAQIVLFRAQENLEDDHSVPDDDLDWSQYTSGQVIVIGVPGTHLTMLNEPHIKTLVAQLQTHLQLSTNGRTIDEK